MESDDKKPVETPETTPAEAPVEPAAEQPASLSGTPAPADALSRTPEELQEEAAKTAADSGTTTEEEPVKPLSPLKKFFRKVNVYLLGFVILVIIAAAIALVNYINSQTAPPEPTIANQELTEEALQQLANNDATVGNTSQTLTIQGNAVIAGQTLMRGNLNIAGNLQTGGSIQGPTLTISGSSNLGDTQINSLQVATNTAIQGNTTLRDVSVSGTSTFSGATTASQITVTRLILSGNAILEIPNHISFTGPTPSREIITSVIGSGGTVSISGSDTAGTVTINTGNTPAAGCFTRIIFREVFARTPRVVVTPVGANAGRLDFYVERNTTSFSLCSANAAGGNQAFAFDYFVTN